MSDVCAVSKEADNLTGTSLESSVFAISSCDFIDPVSVEDVVAWPVEVVDVCAAGEGHVLVGERVVALVFVSVVSCDDDMTAAVER